MCRRSKEGKKQQQKTRTTLQHINRADISLKMLENMYPKMISYFERYECEGKTNILWIFDACLASLPYIFIMETPQQTIEH